MASWMIHLRVAQQLYRQLNIESINEFVLGNIAPDSGIPSKDGSGFIPDAAVSHFRSLDENGIKNIHEEQFIRRYFTPAHRLSYSKKEDAFFPRLFDTPAHRQNLGKRNRLLCKGKTK